MKIHRKMGLKRGVRIWGLYTILIEGREGRVALLGEQMLHGRKRGERSLTRKQMTFLKDKWALRRIDRRYHSLWQCLSRSDTDCSGEQKIRFALGRGFMTIEFLGGSNFR